MTSLNYVNYNLTDIDFSEPTLGYVMKCIEDGSEHPNSTSKEFDITGEQTDNKSLGFYIPKLMPLIEMGTSANDSTPVTLNDTFLINKTKPTISKTVNTKNYLTAIPLRISNLEQPKLFMGDSSLIWFENGNIKRPRYTPFMADEQRRKSDRFRIFLTAKANSTDDQDEESEYELVMDSVDQYVRIKTTDKNSEKSTYEFLINAKDGEILIHDNEDNSITMNTDDELIKLENKSGSKVELSKTNISIKCDDEITVECKKFSVDASQELSTSTATMSCEADSKIEIKSKASFELEAMTGETKYNTTYKSSSPIATFDMKMAEFTTLVKIDSQLQVATPMPFVKYTEFNMAMTVMSSMLAAHQHICTAPGCPDTPSPVCAALPGAMAGLLTLTQSSATLGM